MSNQGDRQATVRTSTGTAGTYEEDWHALFDAAAIPAGAWDCRLLQWINAKLSAAYAEINGAMNAFAASQGYPSWSEMGVFTIAGAAAALLLESGANLLLENGNFFQLEH